MFNRPVFFMDIVMLCIRNPENCSLLITEITTTSTLNMLQFPGFSGGTFALNSLRKPPLDQS